MGALSKIQYWEHAKTGMTGKQTIKELKNLKLIPKNKMIDDQLNLLGYLAMFTAGLIVGIFTQII